MGWHKINPNTGAPAKDSHSALSKPPDFVLLNAVPGVDDSEVEGSDTDCYLGDGPWDMASTLPAEVEEVTGEARQLSDEQLRDLLLRRVVPPGVDNEWPDMGVKLLHVVDAFWKDIDSCYEDDWDRPAKPAEKRWICENVIACRKNHAEE
jgi:hypothetical protein